ncbi:MAG: SGNH/GDSL hydrolase family protein [Dehalococcoidia bacterium]
MRVLITLVAIVTAVVTGIVVLFFAGEAEAIATSVAVLGAGIAAAWFAPRTVRGPVLGLLLFALVAGTAYAGFTSYRLGSGLLDRTGPAEAADPAALASGSAKIDAVRESAAFRLAITDEELTAVVQDGLTRADSPIRAVHLEFVDGGGEDTGLVRFEAAFKSGSLSAHGLVSYALEAGSVAVRVQEVNLGTLTLPRSAQVAVDDLIGQVVDLDQVLTANEVTVQALDVEDGHLVLVGTRRDGTLVPSAPLLDGIRAQSAELGAASAPPAEVLGPGVVDAMEAPGSPLYVALGDSLAANVGVTDARAGYVSRLHHQLQQRDGREYGLHNFGVSGESSGTMLHGQLEDALAVMDTQDVAYVTIDIGANDLLPHLVSDDCADAVDAPACQDRVDASLAAYEENLDTILGRLRDAAPDATIVFLQTYNPFSFGFSDLPFEAQTDAVTADLNARAASVAAQHDVLVADGYTPFQRRAATMTHMAASTPDIHPLAVGYDALAQALLDAM